MKKLLLSLVLGFLLVQTNAQFSMTTIDDQPIENGQTFTFNTTTEEDAKLGYIVHNDSDALILMKAEVIELIDSDGSEFELCFGGSCYYSINQGLIMPQSPVAIQPGGIQGMFDHMWNKNTSSPYMSAKIKFFMIDTFGAEVGEPLIVNYIYNENLGVQDIEQAVKSQVQNTIIKDILMLDLHENSTINIYSVSGKLIKATKANQGKLNLNLSNLNKGQYIVVVNSASGKTASTKVLVK